MTSFPPPSHLEGGRWDSRRNHQLRLPLGAAGGKSLAAEGRFDIALEVGVEEREGPGKPSEVLLRHPQYDGILKCHHEPGAERGTDQHTLAEMLAGSEHLLEMLARLRI